MEEAKTMKTPMSSSIKLDKDEKGKPIDSTMYRGMIGSLLYLTSSRPDIMYSEDWRLGFWILAAFSSSHVSHSIFSHFTHSLLPLGHRASAQLSHLSWKHTKSGDYFGADFPYFGAIILFEATYGIGDPIISTVRGVEIHLDLESICRIFNITDPLGVLDDDAHDLMLREHDLHTPLWLLPHQSTDFEAPSAYDMYGDQSMGRMKFEKAPDGSWGQAYPRVEEEAKIREMEGGVNLQNDVQFEVTFSKLMMSESTYTTSPSIQPTFTKPLHTKIPPPQTLLTPDHDPLIDLSAHISSLGTHMEELAVRIERIEDRLESQHEEMMAYPRFVFPPPPPHP
ncbi:hypothetical protein AAG906_011202 [Vitis piasezkii]